MDRQMEPTNQMFSQGGILSKDWFSDKLKDEDKEVNSPKRHRCLSVEARHHTRYTTVRWLLPCRRPLT